MAGTDPRFSATKFREGIKFAMQMGFPGDTAQQITWHWDTARSFVKPDSGGHPYEWTSGNVSTETDITDLIVDCAVSFKAQGGNARVGGTTLGVMDISSAVVTLLDVDYAAILAHSSGRFPDKAIMDGNIYEVQFIAPPYGLFDVTVYDAHLQAVDES